MAIRNFIATATLTAVGVVGVAGSATAQEARNYLLTTASTGGTYYPVGVALATLMKVKLEPDTGIGLSAISSAGSAENVSLLRDDEAQFAILQGLYGYYAWNGVGPFEDSGRQDHLRAVSMLWQNVEQFLLRSEFVDTGTITDLKEVTGRSMGLGTRNSGTIESNRVILGNFGIDIDEDYDLFYAGYGPSVDAMQDGRVAGTGTPAGVPTSAVTRALASMGDDVTLLGFTPEQVEQADGGLGIWTEYPIPAETYPNQAEEVVTIAQPNFLAVRSDIDEETVYLITKTMYENLPFLRGIHQATAVMAVEKAIAGLPMPLHPGAARFYEEQGMEIPENLLPTE